MILDSSAIIAILLAEPDAPVFAEAIERAGHVSLSVATVLECTIVLGRARRAELDEFLVKTKAVLAPVDGHHLSAAQDAWMRYGRGSNSPARLNYGDCFAYAAAKVSGQPLLFKGNDFTHTDINAAL